VRKGWNRCGLLYQVGAISLRSSQTIVNYCKRIIDDRIANTRALQSSLAERAEDVTMPKALYTDVDLDEHQVPDNAIDVDTEDKDDIDWASLHVRARLIIDRYELDAHFCTGRTGR
jgi:hypothetical protein